MEILKPADHKKQSTQKKGGGERNKMEGPKSSQMKNPPKKLSARGIGTNQVPKPLPPITRSIVDKERAKTFERMSSLEKPSPTITTHLKIKVTCVQSNTPLTPFVYKINAKSKEEGF